MEAWTENGELSSSTRRNSLKNNSLSNYTMPYPQQHDLSDMCNSDILRIDSVPYPQQYNPGVAGNSDTICTN
jgi:hypothetical protein